jgi:S-DNA-T family DNA segregation ATPase FtsK/SpoIIIE
LAARSVKSTTYQGSLDPFAPPPAWIWPLSSLLCWLLAVLLAMVFIGYKPAASNAHFLGATGNLLAGLFLQSAGAAAWALVGFLILAGAYLWREKQAAALVWLAGGGLWLMAGAAVMLGFFDTKILDGAIPLGGEAGIALAAALNAALPQPLNWFTPALAAALGLGVVAWSMWPVIIGVPDMLNLPGLVKSRVEKEDAAEKAEPEPLDDDAGEPPQPEPLAGGEPQEPTPAVGLEDGPRIKPRLEAPKANALLQEKLSFGNAKYRLPTLDLLQDPPDQTAPDQAESLKYNSRLLEKKLIDFGVKGQVVEVAPGPVVTMYEFQPAPGVKISKVAGLSDDLAMNLRASSIRIVAPIPGKAVIGIEIPNNTRETVYLRDLLASHVLSAGHQSAHHRSGQGHPGHAHGGHLGRMPHLFIAGATGSGKSVFINTLILSILYRAPGPGAAIHGGPQAHRAFALQPHPPSALSGDQRSPGGHRRTGGR